MDALEGLPALEGQTGAARSPAGGAQSRTDNKTPNQGTLIRSVGPRANALHKNAFAAAFREVFATDTTIDVIQHVSTCARHAPGGAED